MPIKTKGTLSQEIWDKISRRLSLWSARDAANSLGFKLDTSREKHAAIWRLIFRNDEWLRLITEELNLTPILIGADIQALFKGSGSEQAYLGLFTYSKPNQLNAYHSTFLQSLQPHIIYPDGTIAFTQSGLHLYAPLLTGHIYTIPSVRRLFRSNGEEIMSAYLDFNTSATYKYTKFDSDFIAGENGKNPSLDDIDQLCYLQISLSRDTLFLSTLQVSDEIENVQRRAEMLASLIGNCARKGWPRPLIQE